MMDIAITLVRFPVGIIASFLVLLIAIPISLILFVGETAIVIVSFPFAALFMDRNSIRNSWLGEYPHSLRYVFRAFPRIWDWVFSD